MKFTLTLTQILRETASKLTYSAAIGARILRKMLFLKPKRRSKLTDWDKRLIEENCRNKWTDQGASLRSLEKILKQEGTPVCKETIRRFINAQPWGKLRRQPRTFMMSRKNREDRLAFGNRFNDMGLLSGNMAVEFAKSILFTDEKYFYLSHRPNPQNHRFRGDISQIIVQGVPKFDAKVLVCAGFSFNGVTPIMFLDSNVNSELYVEQILPFYKEQFERPVRGQGVLKNALFDREGRYFQQDGAKPHTAKVSIAYIQENFPDYFADWPGNSPDLNPIENLWAIVQEKVDHYPFASSLHELRARIEKAWTEIDPVHLQNLALAFPKRLKALLI